MPSIPSFLSQSLLRIGRHARKLWQLQNSICVWNWQRVGLFQWSTKEQFHVSVKLDLPVLACAISIPWKPHPYEEDIVAGLGGIKSPFINNPETLWFGCWTSEVSVAFTASAGRRCQSSITLWLKKYLREFNTCCSIYDTEITSNISRFTRSS